MRYILIFIIVFFFSCGKTKNKENSHKISLDSIYKLISNDSVKYWYLVEKNNKILTKKTVWMFNEEQDYYKYFYKSKDSLLLKGNDSDKLYSNKFRVTKDSIFLNSIPYKLIYLSEDSMYIKSIGLKVILKKDSPPKYIDSTKPIRLKIIN